jgi:hypothetical protein
LLEIGLLEIVFIYSSHFPITPHPTFHTLFLNQEIIFPELNRDVFLPW